jgi:hypothetical protein
MDQHDNEGIQAFYQRHTDEEEQHATREAKSPEFIVTA